MWLLRHWHLTVLLSFWPSFRDGKGHVAIKWPIHFHHIGSILVDKWNPEIKDWDKSDLFQGGIFQGQVWRAVLNWWVILVFLCLYYRCATVRLDFFWKPLPELLALHVTHLHRWTGQAFWGKFAVPPLLWTEVLCFFGEKPKHDQQVKY